MTGAPSVWIWPGWRCDMGKAILFCIGGAMITLGVDANSTFAVLYGSALVLVAV